MHKTHENTKSVLAPPRLFGTAQDCGGTNAILTCQMAAMVESTPAHVCQPPYYKAMLQRYTTQIPSTKRARAELFRNCNKHDGHFCTATRCRIPPCLRILTGPCRICPRHYSGSWGVARRGIRNHLVKKGCGGEPRDVTQQFETRYCLFVETTHHRPAPVKPYSTR